MAEVFYADELQEVLGIDYPMLMLDRAMINDENNAVGLKNLSANELYFQGHFPDHPIMPGVLQVEAMKQLAQLLVCQKLDETNTRNIYIKKMEKVKFRKPNNPGDRVKVSVELLSLENNEATLKCSTANAGGVTCQANLTLAVRDLEEYQNQMPELFNEYDKNDEIMLDTEGIKGVIPHRYPFLLVDNLITTTDDDLIIATKNLTIGEEFFNGHRYGEPVLPESLQAEIVAQAGCTFVLQDEKHRGKLAFFMGIDKAEFLRPAFPGDQLVCKVVMPPVKSRFGKGQGKIYVENELIAEVSITFAIMAQ